ncbi:hypothetical protein [Cellulomonas sp. A375-1]|uniref:hypothetical protein n=1 Tax=Cellulomonas sp. A375-1 TaxID=1672219 RepID=UPI000ACDD373|nr:hypothetical protein [Cellulomonas sp. A375-1]
MKSRDESTPTVIAVPHGVDPRWREKIEVAKKARVVVAAARKGKPSSFRPVAGFQGTR